MSTKIHLVVIDPQNDFMDLPGSALPVSGANEDMNRLADFVRTYGDRLADIHVTLDSHQPVDIAHPAWWVTADGKEVSPFTMITSSDIEAGIYRQRDPRQRQRSLEYTKQLEKDGKKVLFIWPPHCRIGTWGHGVQVNLMDALLEWCTSQYAMIDFVTKGTSPYTEHYGALMAEVPDPEDPSTQLNTAFIEILQQADKILIGGEALSHCVMETINQIVDNIGNEHVKKICILRDATSPVLQSFDATGTPTSPDFPAIAEQWLKDIQQKGVSLTSTKTYFN